MRCCSPCTLPKSPGPCVRWAGPDQCHSFAVPAQAAARSRQSRRHHAQGLLLWANEIRIHVCIFHQIQRDKRVSPVYQTKAEQYINNTHCSFHQKPAQPHWTCSSSWCDTYIHTYIHTIPAAWPSGASAPPPAIVPSFLLPSRSLFIADAWECSPAKPSQMTHSDCRRLTLLSPTHALVAASGLLPASTSAALELAGRQLSSFRPFGLVCAVASTHTHTHSLEAGLAGARHLR